MIWMMWCCLCAQGTGFNNTEGPTTVSPMKHHSSISDSNFFFFITVVANNFVLCFLQKIKHLSTSARNSTVGL